LEIAGDLICNLLHQARNLLHQARRAGVDPEVLLDKGREHFAAEIADEEADEESRAADEQGETGDQEDRTAEEVGGGE
jgi:hypothetical protein